MAEPTEWVPSTTKPRFPGWYEVAHSPWPTGDGGQLLKIDRWRFTGSHWRDEDTFVRLEQFHWRGLNEPTHAADCAVNAPPDQPTGPCNCYLSKETT